MLTAQPAFGYSGFAPGTTHYAYDPNLETYWPAATLAVTTADDAAIPTTPPLLAVIHEDALPCPPALSDSSAEDSPMKYAIMSAIRSLGLLSAADRVRFFQKRAMGAHRNRRFLQTHPDFVPPPADLAFDAYGMVDLAAYHEGGLRHARIFADAILSLTEGHRLRVLEWGCGPGRLIRHMPTLLAPRAAEVAGTDYNAATIAWCKANVPGVDFSLNGLMPPLPFPDDHFDVAYNFSVLTHLSEAAQLAWTEELKRVIKPGGVLLSTTHGENYRYLLTAPEERAAFSAGECVTQGRYAEGKKFYFAIHPPLFVRQRLLAGFVEVDKLPVPADAHIQQDLWFARKEIPA